MTEPRFRPIDPDDDAEVARVIREVMTEFRCSGDGFAITDPEVDAMSAAYPGGDACFYVVEDTEGIAGCGGFARLVGSSADDAVAELRKMYFRARLRARGVGSRFLTFLLAEMRTAGFAECYLETTSWMNAARSVYLKHGFRELARPRGATGHSGCDRFFSRHL